MEMFRSEDMKHVAITMTNDAAHATVKEIGRFAKMHVVDLGAAEGHAPLKEHTFYKKRMADCQYWERRLASLTEELERFNIYNEGARANIDYVPEEIDTSDIIATVAQSIEPLEAELNSSINFIKENRRIISSQIERRYTLQLCKDLDLAGQTRRMARDAAAAASWQNRSVPRSVEMDVRSSYSDMGDEERPSSRLQSFRSYITGIIAIDQQPAFRRMLYRVSRGNAFARFADIPGLIDDPASGERQRKSVFYVMVLGQQLHQRISRMCQLFKANIYELPENRDGFLQTLASIRQDVLDKEAVARQTEEHIVGMLTRLGSENGTSPLANFQHALQVERSMCHCMMKAHFYLTMICIEGWVPTQELPALRLALTSAVAGTGHPPAALEVEPANPIRLPGAPPTFFPTNKFTAPFQGIVDTYGTPRYKEVNPGLFTLISFPFLFGVMYGDIGHGIMLMVAAFAMIYWEEKIGAKEKAGTLSEIPSMAFGGRYVLALMGIFATYAGIIYNDCLSTPLNVYGSTWEVDPSDPSGLLMYQPTRATYPCGVDPAWFHKQNELAFSNSLKMKVAVILGVCQMLFGIILSAFNHLYFKDYLSLYWEFIPRLVFLLSTFGYMIWMILYKWCQDWVGEGRHAPNLIQTMIAMFLSPGSIEEDKQLYQGQAGLQVFLLLCAFISVPIMLIAKPYILKKQHEAGIGARAGSGGHAPIPLLSPENDHDAIEHSAVWSDMSPSAGAGAGGDEYKDGPASFHPLSPPSGLDASQIGVSMGSDPHAGHAHAYNFSDELIHNSIHTIEFVLGAVSNTASYLRLWALSLAHAELSKVFWSKMILQYGALTGSPFMMFIGFAVWFGATFAVLLCMDVLECFLHALRLHWVEFQNKFYYGDGVPFVPFTLTQGATQEKQS